MAESVDIPKRPDSIPVGLEASGSADKDGTPPSADYLSAGYAQSSSRQSGLGTPGTPGGLYTPGMMTPGSPGMLSRTASMTNLSEIGEDEFPPLDRLTVFDVLENLALPQHFERIQERVRRQQAKLRSSSRGARDKVVEEWRRRVPTSEEQLKEYRKRMRDSVDRMNKRWNDTRTITVREKVSFIGGVLNIFISGYLIGAAPEWFHIWYTAQLVYYMPIRWYTYHQKGMHYFLADLCYFVNFLMVLSIWFFPNSKRLFISTFCLAFGNNAVAIAMWRNSLVFHSLDKVTSLFIHIMPCATLHCLIHLIPIEMQQEKFPAIYNIKFSPADAPEHYTLREMIIWATVPYAVWQLSYHFLITVRRREKIAAGRPTSFTWLRKSYAKNFLGKFVLRQPEYLQEPCFMMIQYVYALLTMTPCPLWFYNRWASAAFLMVVFTWATYNGATFYIDVFGRRMERELDAIKRDIARWQTMPEGRMLLDEGKSPVIQAMAEEARAKGSPSTQGQGSPLADRGHARTQSLEELPPLDQPAALGKEELKNEAEHVGMSSSYDGKQEETDGVRKR